MEVKLNGNVVKISPMTIPSSKQNTILSCLNDLEIQHQIKIFYACESGSRAWGFASQDSDYDVRFLYLHRPEWYLSINLEKKPDVLELPIETDLDVSGWDLRKALQLFYKSNPPLMEWLGSPIIYREQFNIAEKMRSLASTYYSPLSAAHHYLNMAKNNFRNYFKGPEVLHKKYFYVLRPLLAIQWLEKKLGVVPTEFQILLDTLIKDTLLKNTIEELMRQKSIGREVDKAPAIPILNDFIEKELLRLDEFEGELQVAQATIESLNLLFQESLKELW